MYYQSSIPQMIQQGQFGVSSPIQQTGYNPYTNQQQMYNGYQYNNMVPLNALPYNKANNNFVFQPINGYNNYYQPQRYDYYNPYGQQQNIYGGYYPPTQYYNPYTGYQSYGNYSPFISPVQQQKMAAEQVALMKIKYKIAAAWDGKVLDEEELDRRINPQNEVNRLTVEQIAERQETEFINYVSALSRMPMQYENNADREARLMREYSANFHAEFDNHSLAEFLYDDLWKFEREEWIRENIIKSAGRNLSTTYNSNEYNELLNMHRSSSPYINDILNTSRYDNNIDDLEIGMNVVYDKERRRQAILSGKIPSFISSEETQKRRAAWTSQIMDQIYKKGAGIIV